MKKSYAILLFISLGFLVGAQSTDLESIWEKGKKAEQEGDYERALKIWETAKPANEDVTQIADPRIGFDYIQLVTQQSMTEYYRDAVGFYMWGITKGCKPQHKEILSTELERLAPIIDEQDYDNLESNIKTDLNSFCQQLVTLWEKMDPTLSNDFNERLLEHWERIAYAKEHFQRSKNTIYNTDERGLIYVRLGEPDIKKNGTMQFNYGLVRSWLQDIKDSQSHSGISMGSFGGDSAGSSGAFFAQAGNEYYQVEKITREALLTHRYPYYEIWVYRDLNESKHNNLVYIFGQDGDDGSFGLRSSLDEMIPNSAFRRGQNKGLVTSGLILQLLFYEQTSQIDTYFEEAFNDLETRILTRNGLNRRTSYIVQDQNRNELATKQFKAPVQETSILDNISNIDIRSYQYRFLDKNNKPVLGIFVESQPQKSIILDQVKEKNYSISNYRLINQLVSVADEDGVIDKQKQISNIYIEGEGSADNMQQSVAYFETPNVAAGIDQIINVELQDQNKDSLRVTEKIFLNNIRAIGITNTTQPEPLSTDKNVLELSDILLGISEENPEVKATGPADFVVIHDKKIPENTDLMIHFQVYHLSPQASGTNKFRVEYQVTKENKGFFKRVFGTKNEVGLTLNFETLDTYYINNLGIDTTPFEPGNYELSLKILEPATNREISRKVTFTIVENGDS